MTKEPLRERPMDGAAKQCFFLNFLAETHFYLRKTPLRERAMDYKNAFGLHPSLNRAPHVQDV